MARETWVDVWRGVTGKLRAYLDHDSGGLLLRERASATILLDGVELRLDSHVTGSYPMPLPVIRR